MKTQSVNFTGWHKIKLPKIQTPEDKFAANVVMTHLGVKTGNYRVPEAARIMDDFMLINVYNNADDVYTAKVKSIIKECNNMLKNEAISKMYVEPASVSEVQAAQSIEKFKKNF